MIKKLLIVLIMVSPVIFDTSCKKQPKCGCGKDVIHTLDKEPVRLVFDVEDNTASFTPLTNPYATYFFCNLADYKETLEGFTSGNIYLVSGATYYECNYLYNSSSYMYYQPSYRVYEIEVSAIEEDLYGKK